MLFFLFLALTGSLWLILNCLGRFGSMFMGGLALLSCPHTGPLEGFVRLLQWLRLTFNECVHLHLFTIDAALVNKSWGN